MQNIRLALSGVVLAAVAAGLGACADSPSAPSTASDPSSLAATAVRSDVVTAAVVASIRLQCERRTNRSRISVDGRGLTPRTGLFRARVTASGGTVTSPLKRAVAGEDEFDFDSNRNDILAGATRIPATFITARTGPDVVAKILNASGQVVATKGAECTFR
jgi:hypothetical protein